MNQPPLHAELAPVSARLVRYNIGRIRLGQTLGSVAIFTGGLARLFGGVLGLVLAGAAMLAALVTYVAARRGFGRRPLSIVKGKINLGEGVPAISPASILRWTLVGPTARLYGKDVSWKVHVRRRDGFHLEANLARVLGRPLSLRRRGTPRGRLIALVVGTAGVLLTVVGFIFPTMPLFLVAPAVAAAIGGFAVFGAFSQRVAD